MKTTLEMAREAGAIHIHKRPKEFAIVGNEAIERFAELVLANVQPASDTLLLAARKVIEEFGTSSDSLQDLYQALKLTPQPEQQEPCGWQFYQDGKWHNGMETNNHRANTEAAGFPVRDVYPSPPAQPQPPPVPPPWWPAVENILSEYGLQAIDFVADFKKALAQPQQEQSKPPTT